MKYLTKEELDFIVNELTNNPSRETIKKLNDKYNGDSSEIKKPTWIENRPSAEYINNNEIVLNREIGSNDHDYSSIYRPGYEPSNAPIWNPINNTDNNIYGPNFISKNTVYEKTTNNSEMTPITNLNIQSEPLNNVQNNNNNQSIPLDYNIPSLNEQVFNANQAENSHINNNNPLPFNGNPWEMQSNKQNSMMQTTDNFNNNIETSSNVRSNIEPMPFFQTNFNTSQNQIPVTEPSKEEGPTMLGQLEQNYNNNAA